MTILFRIPVLFLTGLLLCIAQDAHSFVPPQIGRRSTDLCTPRAHASSSARRHQPLLTPMPARTTAPQHLKRRSSTSPPSSLTALHSSSSSIWSHTLEIVKTFSSSSALQSVTDRALQTPPIVYFFALLLAGVGVPVSEDALCLFAGTVWSTLERGKQWRLLLCLYAGVVLSDVVTFWIGRALRTGMMEPIRKRMQLVNGSESSNSTTEEQEQEGEEVKEMSMVSVEALDSGGRVRKRDKLKQAMNNAGDYIGFVIRFSVGTRGPLMLLTGFTKKVSFVKFFLGTTLGAMITVPLQLYLGYTLGHNHPAAVVGIVGGISTFVLVVAATVAIASWGTLLLKQVQKWQTAKS